MILYYKILNKENKFYVSERELITNGITYETKSNYGTKVGLGNPQISGTPFDKAVNKPEWLDFKKAIPCKFEKLKNEKYLYFEAFTNKIMVFNKEITSDIVDQEYYILLENDEERYAFDTGKTIQKLYSEYWNSMMSLEEYIRLKPYKNSEVFIFENIPAELLHIEY